MIIDGTPIDICQNSGDVNIWCWISLLVNPKLTDTSLRVEGLVLKSDDIESIQFEAEPSMMVIIPQHQQQLQEQEE